MNLVYLDSHDLNFSNRLVWTRMPGGVAGARLTAAPYADQEFVQMLGLVLDQLHEYSAARYQLRRSEFWAWKQVLTENS